MGWFDDQLTYRKETDEANFSDAIHSLAGAVMGRRLTDALSHREMAKSAIDEILKYYHCTPKTDDIPSQIKTVEEQMEYRMRPFGIMNRSVELDHGWYHQAVGAMLGTLKEDGSPVALIPGKFRGYSFLNLKTGKRTGLNRKTEKLLDREAVCFYMPLPMKKLNAKDLFLFMVKQMSISDIVMYLVLMAGSTGLGMLSPLFTRWLFSTVIESKSLQLLISLAVYMLCFSICRLLFGCYQALINGRIGIKQNIAVQAAVMSRMMSLPPNFFRKYSSGEMSQRSGYVQSLCSTLFSVVGTTGLTSLFSLSYIVQIFTFAPALVLPSLLFTAATAVLSLTVTFMQMKISRRQMDLSAKTSGMTYATITGIQKIKLAGAEKRMFSRWANQYAQEASLTYSPPTFLKLSGTLSMTVSLAGTLVLYAIALKSGVNVADYYAFNTSYSMVSSAFMSLSSIAVTVANIFPMVEMAKPILDAEPEMQDGKEILTELKGAIELSHVSFRYEEDGPNVIDDLSLQIRPGEYIAVVGATGCGKSTLLRLLLGFEKPAKGSIFYDRKDISKVDIESLRRKIGVVMQDGKLFMGDIYSNIVISAPQLTLNDAWEAAEIASLADDIRAMPMGMNTIISEGQGGISGGQRQRMMIARAIAPKPKILMFDEATSALDNVTQKKVSEAVDSLRCTRIVIAHRLSTIRHADRILFLKDGKIAEEGTYETLIAKNGLFAELVERQRLDVDVE